MRQTTKIISADVAECALFVALMTASAYITIPFPLVPLTFQTVVSVLAGLLLGAKKGVLAMSAYALAGLLGLPVFAAGGGIYYVLKPSFGYILGFILAAFVAGLIAGGGRPTAKRYSIAAVAAFFADYLVGIPYCIVAAHLSGVEDLVNLFIFGNLIYMPKDLCLCLLAAMVAERVRPAVALSRAKK